MEEGEFKKSDSSIPPIRTFKADYDTLVKDKKIGKVEMLAAEIRRGTDQSGPEEISPKQKLNSLIAGMVVVAIVLAGYLGYLILVPSKPAQPQKQLAQIAAPILFSERQEVITLKDATQSELAAAIGKKLQQPFPRNNVVYVPIIKDSDVAQFIIDTSNFFKIAGFAPSADFIQSLDSNYMMGIYSQNERSPFLIFKIKLYENAFAGIIGWEDKMANDLGKIWPIKSFGAADKFKDRYLSNHDIRELDNDNGDTVLMYSFLDRSTLVITTNEDTLKAIFERFTFR
jgi:hypothetical protein